MYRQKILRGYEQVRSNGRRVLWRRQAELSPEERHYYDAMLLDRALPMLVFDRQAVSYTAPAAGERINFQRFEMITPKDAG